MKSNLQATVRNLQSGFQRSFSYPSKETDDALGDMRSQIEKITRAHPAGVRISLQRTNSFDGTPVIVQKVVSTRPSQSGNARNVSYGPVLFLFIYFSNVSPCFCFVQRLNLPAIYVTVNLKKKIY